MKIKMCGLRTLEDIQAANEVKPDYVGFIFADTWRYISPRHAKELRDNLDSSIKTVGVFVNETVDKMMEVAKEVHLDVIQLHGDETKDTVMGLRRLPGIEVWKAARVSNIEDIEAVDHMGADKILLDSFSKEAYGGTGKVMDISLVEKAKITKPFFVAGGLTTENINGILERTNPFGIDISSGIETDKKKDKRKMKKVMDIVGGYHG